MSLLRPIAVVLGCAVLTKKNIRVGLDLGETPFDDYLQQAKSLGAMPNIKHMIDIGAQLRGRNIGHGRRTQHVSGHGKDRRRIGTTEPRPGVEREAIIPRSCRERRDRVIAVVVHGLPLPARGSSGRAARSRRTRRQRPG